jgi:hypothetical protein
VAVSVVDAAGDTATTSYTLAVLPADALRITTGSLPQVVGNEAFTAALAATGGVKPYLWELLSGDAEITLDSATGALAGSLPESGERVLQVRVTDAQQSIANAELKLSVTAGVEITTESPLLPVAPLTAVELSLEAKGGQPPYRWSVSQGSLPQGVRLGSDGKFMGTASAQEGLFQFTVRVQDSRGTHYEKSYQWAVHQGLIAQASRDCVGLAWRQSQLAQVLGFVPQAVSVTRDGRMVYQGASDNFVDAPVQQGSHLYVLSAVDGSGSLKPAATARVTVLPTTLSRAVRGRSADPYADRVRQFAPLSAGGYGSAQVPNNVTGPPDGKDTFSPAFRQEELVSLHASNGGGGSIVLEFTDNIVRNGPGLDFTVFENVFFVGRDPSNRFMEPAVVEVALWEGEWQRLPFAVNPPADGLVNLRHPGYYAHGFAGVNAATGDDPTDPSRSGGDSFDYDPSGRSPLTWIKFIRITATGDKSLRDVSGNAVAHTRENNALAGTGSSGFDLDAVSAVHW